jgi:hypothetical protein
MRLEIKINWGFKRVLLIKVSVTDSLLFFYVSGVAKGFSKRPFRSLRHLGHMHFRDPEARNECSDADDELCGIRGRD